MGQSTFVAQAFKLASNPLGECLVSGSCDLAGLAPAASVFHRVLFFDLDNVVLDSLNEHLRLASNIGGRSMVVVPEVYNSWLPRFQRSCIKLSRNFVPI